MNKIISLIALLFVIIIYTLFALPLSNNYSDITFTIDIEDEAFKSYEVTKIEKSAIISIDKQEIITINNTPELQNGEDYYRLVVEIHEGMSLAGDMLYFKSHTIELINEDYSGSFTIKHVKNSEDAIYRISLRDEDGQELDYVQAPLYQ